MVTPEQFVAILTALTALVGAMVAVLRQVHQTHALVNSRMEELLALTRTSSRAEGRLEGPDAQEHGTGAIPPRSFDGPGQDDDVSVHTLKPPPSARV